MKQKREYSIRITISYKRGIGNDVNCHYIGTLHGAKIKATNLARFYGGKGKKITPQIFLWKGITRWPIAHKSNGKWKLDPSSSIYLEKS